MVLYWLYIDCLWFFSCKFVWFVLHSIGLDGIDSADSIALARLLGFAWGLLGGYLGVYLGVTWGLLAFTWGFLETAFTQTTRLNTKSSHITPNETHA